MGQLADNISQAVRENRYAFGLHAQRRLRERRIMGWQVVQGLEQAKLLVEREGGVPHPVAEFEVALPDGALVKVAWAWIEEHQLAKLVTVFFYPGMP